MKIHYLFAILLLGFWQLSGCKTTSKKNNNTPDDGGLVNTNDTPTTPTPSDTPPTPTFPQTEQEKRIETLMMQDTDIDEANKNALRKIDAYLARTCPDGKGTLCLKKEAWTNVKRRAIVGITSAIAACNEEKTSSDDDLKSAIRRWKKQYIIRHGSVARLTGFRIAYFVALFLEQNQLSTTWVEKQKSTKEISDAVERLWKKYSFRYDLEKLQIKLEDYFASSDDDHLRRVERKTKSMLTNFATTKEGETANILIPATAILNQFIKKSHNYTVKSAVDLNSGMGWDSFDKVSFRYLRLCLLGRIIEDKLATNNGK